MKWGRVLQHGVGATRGLLIKRSSDPGIRSHARSALLVIIWNKPQPVYFHCFSNINNNFISCPNTTKHTTEPSTLLHCSDHVADHNSTLHTALTCLFVCLYLFGKEEKRTKKQEKRVMTHDFKNNSLLRTSKRHSHALKQVLPRSVYNSTRYMIIVLLKLI